VAGETVFLRSAVKKPVTGLHPERQRVQARAAFVEVRGEGATQEREQEIAALPVVAWKGKRLRTIRCTGTTGRGPHLVNVPEALLWSLISLTHYRCPYHA
jgi:hypothetical protein